MTTISALIEKMEEAQYLKKEVESLEKTLDDVKSQSEVEVNSLKQILADSDNLMEKVRKTYDTQIENFSIMSDKLTNHIKDKAAELDVVRKEKERLQQTIEDMKKGNTGAL